MTYLLKADLNEFLAQEAKPCPICGKPPVVMTKSGRRVYSMVFDEGSPGYRVVPLCTCGIKGPWANTLIGAVKEWNAYCESVKRRTRDG